jgi:hypothetical protein
MTEWRPSPVFPEEYAISSRGDVWSVRKRRTIKPALDKSGYLYYVLCVDGKRRTVKAHRLVGLAFIPNPKNKPTINHKNGIRTDNRVENLEWATHKEQKNDPLTKQHMAEVYGKTDYQKMGARRNFGRVPVTIIWADGAETECGSLLEASRVTGKSCPKLSEVINGKRKQYKDFCIAVTKKRFGEEGADDGLPKEERKAGEHSP